MINNDFYIFIKDNQIIATTIATIFSRLIADVSYSFIENILLPIINIDLDNDFKADINSFKIKNLLWQVLHLKLVLLLLKL